MHRPNTPILATLACLLAAACSAQAPAPVLKSLVAGDRACYVETTDATGATQEHLASFEACEQAALVGKPVKLTSRMESIAAESCQGDPQCTQSEQVLLVVKIEPAQ